MPHSVFEVVHRGRDRGGYLYEIRRDGRAVAELWHNHRNEDHMARRSTLGAVWEDFEDILEGGGPEPLSVSATGTTLLLRYLDTNA